jgi:hypothetical protein
MKVVLGLFAVLAAFVGVITIAFALNLGGLEWSRYFNPKREDVKRETFERNKSYVHGSIQDLGKRYREYQAADPQDRDALGRLVAIEFAEFDADLISNLELRSFLIEQRGY